MSRGKWLRRVSLSFILALWGCGSSPSSTSGDFTGSSGSSGSGGSGASTGSGGSNSSSSSSGSSRTTGSSGSGSSSGSRTTGSSGSGGSSGTTGSSSGTGGSSGASSGSSGGGHADAGSDSGSADASSEAGADTGAADTGSGANTVTGTLGTMPLNPIMSAYWINTSPGETIVYLIAGSVSCSQLATPGWLATITSGVQVVELVMPSTTTTGMVSIPGGEANYAFGGMSSLTETNAVSGTINITKNDPMGAIEGSVSAMYASGSVMGSFHADFCAGGMGY